MRGIWVIVIVVVALACVCLGAMACLGIGAFAYFNTEQVSPPFTVDRNENLPEPVMEVTPGGLPTLPMRGTSTPAVPQGPTQINPQSNAGAAETLQTLSDTIVPNNDPVELAQRLGQKGDIPETVPSPPAYNVGDSEEFWASNVDTNENFRVTALLAYETDHAYFWIEDGVRYNNRDLEQLAESFENEIYPTNREFFGSEWSPGIDNDPHLNILFARGLGNSIAGYFSSADSVHPDAHEFSNAREMFLLNADNVDLSQDFTYGVLAHEFQHMIHWYRDRNEDSWLNEGFSELAAFLNGFDPGGFDYAYMVDPDLQLNDWPNDSSATTPHYGASFLFLNYFLNRFGDDATKAVVNHDENGLESIDLVLTEQQEQDPASGEPVTADSVFADWAVTNYLLDSSVGDGRYTYENYSEAPQAFDTQIVTDCGGDWVNNTVNQYGVDYINLSCSGNVTLNFRGQTEVGVLPQSDFSGDYAFWSNKGDESDMTLTQTFDFTQVNAPIEMSFRTWYDLEEDYDYLFLVASTDGGETWQIVNTPSCTSEDPSGNSYGCGYNGTTDGWVDETVDLSAFAGQEVTLRFEYVTDAAVNGEGFLLDDVSIPAVGYSTDFEGDNGGWEPAGFVRIQNRLPQTFILSLIRREGSQTSVETLALDENQSLSLPLDFSGSLDQAVLVVSGSTRFTRQDASYSFQIQP